MPAPPKTSTAASPAAAPAAAPERPNALLTSAGRRVSLLRIVQRELRALNGPEAKVFTTDLDPEMSTACRLSDGGLTVGRFRDEGYMPYLLELCLVRGIGVVIPTLDPELPLYAAWRARFAEAGVDIVVSDGDFVAACNDKAQTSAFFARYGIGTAEEYSADAPAFPMFVRPRRGSSGKDLHVVTSAAGFAERLKDGSQFVYSAYLDPARHTEFTVDLYFDREHRLRCCVPRERIAVRGGEVSKGVTRRNFLVDYLNSRLACVAGARGCVTLQVFVEEGTENVYGIEINPRFGGGYPLSDAARAAYVRWVLEEWRGRIVTWRTDWTPNLYMLRYDEELFFELSSTSDV